VVGIWITSYCVYVMASRNGQSIFDLITSGWSRTVFDRNGNERPAVSIPAEFAEENDIEIGDDVAVVEGDEKGALELHFE